ncbi:hypothetical protein [Thioalkalivibrio sp. ALJ24]|uniref:hypothetical protein n=1 Tax=Thioalkalivibrio sp. ALJ24 TaxID=545276 RepID=UPI0003657367|nr:hypothetical protein [Thioalkalivibrio sp. ALJ24]
MPTVLRLFDRLPLWLFALIVATVGLWPWQPEPAIAGLVRDLLAGELAGAAGWGGLLLHGLPWLLMALRLARQSRTGV